ncbi:MAG: hypothetical protein HUJ25_06910 [Crocinitomicaceae bacterium]|nr:hypothetical protein [Crocinitomicaceae bacterium]
MDTLKITDNLQLKEIKARFSEKFPHLKIEFFSEEHGVGEASKYSTKYDDELYLRDIRSTHNEGDLEISGSLLTSEFESNFHNQFGVNVQVLRRSRNMWIQTTTTDRWTLDQQEESSIKEGS